MNRLSTAREIAILRHSSEPGPRAFAAAALAAGDSVTGSSGDDPATRMFGFGLRHDAALPWDGRSARSGTITFLDDERIEQYVGGQKWVAYRRSDLGVFLNDVGDQVRIARRGDAIAVELIGPNRLQDSRSKQAREVYSGMLILRSAEFTTDEVGSCAASVAERYGAVVNSSEEAVWLDFRGAAQLTITPAAASDFDGSPATALMAEPAAAAVRVATVVRSNKLDAAVDAERALALLAAMLSSEGEAVAIDDGGAIFSAEQLYLLGTRNEMRGDAFSFAAAAAQRQAPPQIWFSDRAGTCDELTIFSSRPWRADFAASFLERELTGLAQARESGDPIVPLQVNTFAGDERGAPGGLERLASLAYDTVEVEVGFIDVAVAGDDVRGRIGARPDVAAMLARPIANAIVIAFGGRAGEAPEPDFVLEMRRAETIATALGAAIARRGESIATDVFGTLYDTEELLALALRRCGKSASWAARVASAALEVA